MARIQYERLKKRLVPDDVARAIWLSQNPSKTARVIEWTDTESVGLVLRIAKRDCNWLIRRHDCTIRIGLCNEIGLPLARDIAQKTRDAAKRGRNLKTFVQRLAHYRKSPQGEYFDAWKEHNDVEWADTIADEKSDIGRRWLKDEFRVNWTWKNLTNEFLAVKLPTLKNSYQPEYEHYLRLPEFEIIEDTLIAKLNISDLELVHDRMLKAYAISTVSRAIRQSREMLTWAWTCHITKAGLSDCQWEWWTRWRVQYKSNIRTRRPTIEELARTMVIADEHRHLADGEHETYPGTVCALWTAVLTAQRTGSLLLLRPDHLFDPDPNLKLRG